ncbi:MAG: hypothetical protein ACI9SP_004839 [Arenicella sp.]|jgi:hypothetical protein
MNKISLLKYSILFGTLSFCVQTSAQQQCNTLQIEQTAPASRFIVNANQTVTDRETKLIWKRCPQRYSGSNCTTLEPGFDPQNPNLTLESFSSASQSAEAESFAGETDWRLPNIKELSSIVERACSSPAINESIFPGTLFQDDFRIKAYWTSTAEGVFFSFFGIPAVYTIDFGTGEVSFGQPGIPYRVRLVRGG